MLKKLASFAAATMLVLSAGSAYANFADLHLIRVYYDRAGAEIATDLGLVKDLTAAGANVSGSFGSLATGFVVYFAIDRTTNEMWASGLTTASTVINGTINGMTAFRSGTSSMYTDYNTQGGTNFTGLASATNSYKNKLSATQGWLANSINTATRLNTEASIAGMILAGSGSVTQVLYYWQNGLTTVAADKIGKPAATITTNADGSTTISAVSAKTNQTIGTISFTPATLAIGGATTASATATSGLPVNFGTITPTVCSVSTGGAISGLTVGTCTVTADQTGDATHNAAPQVTQNITVLTPQAIGPISFVPPNLTVGRTSTASAVASSGLTVTTFGTTTPSVCSVSGSTVSGVALGICTVTADQAGDATTFVAPASQATQNIQVVAPIIKINTATIPDNTLNAALAIPVVDATIYIQAAPVFEENVLMSNPVTIQLKGGYTDAAFTSQTSFTTIKGSLTIKGGTLKATNLIVR